MSKVIWTFEQYVNEMHRASKFVDQSMIDLIVDDIEITMESGRDRKILVCGNGGSAAIADHLTCDCVKGVAEDTHLRPHVMSLVANGPMLTAIANDIGYDEVFARQIEYYARPFDTLIVISSSGESPNIIKALQAADRKNMKTIAITGFNSDNSAGKLAIRHIHIPSDNYGIIEDLSMSIIHYIAQTLRREHSSKAPEDIKY